MVVIALVNWFVHGRVPTAVNDYSNRWCKRENVGPDTLK